MFVGPSSGAHLVVARRWLERHPGSTVVTFASDEGEKYLTADAATGTPAAA